MNEKREIHPWLAFVSTDLYKELFGCSSCSSCSSVADSGLLHSHGDFTIDV